MRPSKNPVVNAINGAIKSDVSTARFRISKEQAAQLRAAEQVSHEEALKVLFGFMRTPRQS